MTIPNSLVTALAFVGIYATVVYITTGIRYLVHWIRFKSLPLSEEQEKIKFLRKYIDQQDSKIESLEKETEKMTLALLNHLS